MAEDTSIKWFRFALRDEFSRRQLGFTAMTDAQAEKITSDDTLFAACYDQYEEWKSAGPPLQAIAISVPPAREPDAALAEGHLEPPAFGPSGTHSTPYSAPSTTSPHSSARGFLIFGGIIAALVLAGLLSRGFDTGYPDGCVSIPDSQGTTIEC